MRRGRINSGVVILAIAFVLGMVAAPRTEPASAVLAAGPTVGGGTVTIQAAADMFLKIEGVEGESTNAAHRGWIEIQSWSWGLSQTSSGGGGAGGATGWELKGHVTLIKRIDKATPLLFKRAADGTFAPLATVELAHGGPTYLKYELRNVIITSIRHADLEGDGLPEEELQLDFGGLKLTYTQYDSSGKPAGQISAEWSERSVIR